MFIVTHYKCHHISFFLLCNPYLSANQSFPWNNNHIRNHWACSTFSKLGYQVPIASRSHSLASWTSDAHNAMHPKYPQKTEEDDHENRARRKKIKKWINESHISYFIRRAQIGGRSTSEFKQTKAAKIRKWYIWNRASLSSNKY